MHVRRIAISADYDVNRKENRRGAVQGNRLEEQYRDVHQEHDARARGDSQTEIGRGRHVEFLDHAEAGVHEQPANQRNRLAEWFRYELECCRRLR